MGFTADLSGGVSFIFNGMFMLICTWVAPNTKHNLSEAKRDGEKEVHIRVEEEQNYCFLLHVLIFKCHIF